MNKVRFQAYECGEFPVMGRVGALSENIESVYTDYIQFKNAGKNMIPGIFAVIEQEDYEIYPNNILEMCCGNLLELPQIASAIAYINEKEYPAKHSYNVHVVKNLAQFKRAIQDGKCFEIVKHYNHPEFVGQIRKPNKIQTNGFYSVEKDVPNSPVSGANDGKGFWAEYGKATDWEFHNGICSQSYCGEKIWEIRLISE